MKNSMETFKYTKVAPIDCCCYCALLLRNRLTRKQFPFASSDEQKTHFCAVLFDLI